jgi:hypothetical protein
VPNSRRPARFAKGNDGKNEKIFFLLRSSLFSLLQGLRLCKKTIDDFQQQTNNKMRLFSSLLAVFTTSIVIGTVRGGECEISPKDVMLLLDESVSF